MNGKWYLFVVLAVAVMIPAVAVADVIISGEISVQGSQTGDAFIINQGPNYKVANISHLFGWIPDKQSSQETMGTLWIGTMSNETITDVNVLEINFTSGVLKNSNFKINVTGGNFAKNTFMVVSNGPLTILPDGNIVGSNNMLEFSLYSGNSVVTGNGPGITEGSFNVSSDSHLYIGFFIPPQGGNGLQNGPVLPQPPPPPPAPPSPIQPNLINGPVSVSLEVQFYLTEN
jgi:hypothetical protein